MEHPKSPPSEYTKEDDDDLIIPGARRTSTATSRARKEKIRRGLNQASLGNNEAILPEQILAPPRRTIPKKPLTPTNHDNTPLSVSVPIADTTSSVLQSIETPITEEKTPVEIQSDASDDEVFIEIPARKSSKKRVSTIIDDQGSDSKDISNHESRRKSSPLQYTEESNSQSENEIQTYTTGESESEKETRKRRRKHSRGVFSNDEHDNVKVENAVDDMYRSVRHHKKKHSRKRRELEARKYVGTPMPALKASRDKQKQLASAETTLIRAGKLRKRGKNQVLTLGIPTQPAKIKVPNYSEWSPAQLQAQKVRFDIILQQCAKKWAGFEVPSIDDFETMEHAHIAVAGYLFHMETMARAQNAQVIYALFCYVVEIAAVRIGLTNFKGWGDYEYRSISDKDSIMIRIGEKLITSSRSTEQSPFTRLMWTIGINILCVFLINLFSPYVSEGIAKGLIDMLRKSFNGISNQTPDMKDPLGGGTPLLPTNPLGTITHTAISGLTRTMGGV